MIHVSWKSLTLLLVGVALGVGGVTACTSYVTKNGGSTGHQERNQAEVRIDDSAAFSEAVDALA